MTQTLITALETVTRTVYAATGQSAVPLTLIAAYAAVSVMLYGMTRGKEFLVAGYSSVLFVVPFMHIG